MHIHQIDVHANTMIRAQLRCFSFNNNKKEPRSVEERTALNGAVIHPEKDLLENHTLS